MTYQLKDGEDVRNGKLYGWTGSSCPGCGGQGGTDDCGVVCSGCGGTGEEWGVMPVQPADLPVSREEYERRFKAMVEPRAGAEAADVWCRKQEATNTPEADAQEWLDAQWRLIVG